MTHPTNTQILTAFQAQLPAAVTDYPIFYAGLTITPPSTGYWLQVAFIPNRGWDMGLSNDSSVVPQGLIQVTVGSKFHYGDQAMAAVAQEVIDSFPKGHILTGLVRVQRTPYTMTPDYLDDRTLMPVTIPYSA